VCWNVVVVLLYDGEEIGGVMLELWQDRVLGNACIMFRFTVDTDI